VVRTFDVAIRLKPLLASHGLIETPECRKVIDSSFFLQKSRLADKAKVLWLNPGKAGIAEKQEDFFDEIEPVSDVYG
jgi:hypothetical protein